MDLYKNPEKEPQDREIEIRLGDPHDWGGTRMNIAGPGGRSNNFEHNERGILQQGLFEAMAFHQEAALGSTHDSHTQGIYSDTDRKYAD